MLNIFNNLFYKYILNIVILLNTYFVIFISVLNINNLIFQKYSMWQYILHFCKFFKLQFFFSLFTLDYKLMQLSSSLEIKIVHKKSPFNSHWKEKKKK